MARIVGVNNYTYIRTAGVREKKKQMCVFEFCVGSCEAGILCETSTTFHGNIILKNCVVVMSEKHREGG